jgi:hypothetical protein
MMVTHETCVRMKRHLSLMLQVGLGRIVEHLGCHLSRLELAERLEPLSAPQEAAVLEHVPTHWMQGPVAALARPVWAAWDLDKTVIEGQVMSQRVLPSLRVLPVIREPIHDELVDLAQRQHLLLGPLYGHCRQSNVRVGRLLVTVRVLAWSRHRRGSWSCLWQQAPACK